ncbi:ribosomal protein L24e-domain-containing protein [Mycena polygramma]|nr:ribosomal protein L24e-domain-containing protein [Mycena polygramma]
MRCAPHILLDGVVIAPLNVALRSRLEAQPASTAPSSRIFHQEGLVAGHGIWASKASLDASGREDSPARQDANSGVPGMIEKQAQLERNWSATLRDASTPDGSQLLKQVGRKELRRRCRVGAALAERVQVTGYIFRGKGLVLKTEDWESEQPDIKLDSIGHNTIPCGASHGLECMTGPIFLGGPVAGLVERGLKPKSRLGHVFSGRVLLGLSRRDRASRDWKLGPGLDGTSSFGRAEYMSWWRCTSKPDRELQTPWRTLCPRRNRENPKTETPQHQQREQSPTKRIMRSDPQNQPQNEFCRDFSNVPTLSEGAEMNVSAKRTFLIFPRRSGELTCLARAEGRDRLILRLPYLPNKGKLFVRGDSKTPLNLSPQVFRFASSKNASLFLQRKNPRKIAWTQVYRRMHKKGITEEVAKKRSRRTVKHQHGIVGADLAAIAAKRNQTAAQRNQLRLAAITKAKTEKKEKEVKKAKPARAAGSSGPKVPKQQMKGGKASGR